MLSQGHAGHRLIGMRYGELEVGNEEISGALQVYLS